MDLQVYVIENPYDNYVESSEIRGIMANIFKLRLDGYKSTYDYGVMPISGLDFFANHIVVTTREGIPVVAFKTIDLDTCKRCGIGFPLIVEIMNGIETRYSEHIKAIDEWLQKVGNAGYCGSWVKNAQYQDHGKEIRELSPALYYFYNQSYQISNIIDVSAVDLKIHKLKEYMGYSYLKHNGKKLGLINVPDNYNTDVYAMHLENYQYGELFVKQSEQYRSLWDDRIILSGSSSVHRQAA